METKKRNVHGYHRKRLKWAIRNNAVFFVIVGVICIIVGFVFGMVVYNYARIDSMETLLDKDMRTLHRVTGMTDEDIEKLKKEYPDFNWEGTWDRSRWKKGMEEVREEKSRRRAIEKYKTRESKRRYELEKAQPVPQREWQ